jgi:hypothetical protein
MDVDGEENRVTVNDYGIVVDFSELSEEEEQVRLTTLV